MTASRDPDRLIRAFLQEGEEMLQDPIYDEVRAVIEHKRQRTFIGPWRISTMNRFLAIGAAAVAVLVVVVIGAQLFGSPTNVGGDGDATPTTEPTPIGTPTASPSPTAVFPSWYSGSNSDGAGILPAGSHATESFTPAFTFSVPAGWVNGSDSAGYFGLFPDTPANQAQFARSDGPAHEIYMGLHTSPWFTCESVENNRGATAAEIVAAMEANEALAVSNPAEVAIGGLTGMQFDARRNPDWTGTCPGDSGLPEGVDPDEERTRGVLLDVPGRGVLVIFVYSVSSAGQEAFLAEAMPIVESFQFSQ